MLISAAAALLLLGLETLFARGPVLREPPTGLNALPPIILWVWERPEDLRPLPPRFGAAVLVATIRVEDGRVAVLPRRQPARLAAGTPWIPVVRIETSRAFRGDGSAEVSSRVVEEIAHRVRLFRASAVQVDFDARRSERPFYRRILIGLRERLGNSTAISITALASWCASDPWFADLPIDEAVPMLFRMGPDERGMRETGFDRSPLCRGSAGVATDEPWPSSRRTGRLYVFSPHPWTKAEASAVQEAASR